MEWRCERCGKHHEENDPPCADCGHGSFERAGGGTAPAADPDTTMVWVCTRCGREHVKHSPPCSRCGTARLERREKRFEDPEPSTPGYLDVVTPRYLAGFGVAVLLASVVILGAVGVLDLPGTHDSGVPEVDDVAGDPGTVGNTSLAAVETVYLRQVNDQRTGQGLGEVERDGRLDEVATFYNQRRVQSAYGDGSRPEDERILELLDDCTGEVYLAEFTYVPDEGDGATRIGEQLAKEHVQRSKGGVSQPGRITGIDLHAAPDRRLFVTQLSC